jgi:hypothetical protein
MKKTDLVTVVEPAGLLLQWLQLLPLKNASVLSAAVLEALLQFDHLAFAPRIPLLTLEEEEEQGENWMKKSVVVVAGSWPAPAPYPPVARRTTTMLDELLLQLLLEKKTSSWHAVRLPVGGGGWRS